MDRRSLVGAALAATATPAVRSAAAASIPGATALPRSLVVEAVQMPVWTDERQPLEPGDSVSTGRSLETGADAALVLRLPEGSLLRLGEKTRLEVPRLEVEHELGTTTVRARLRLVDGFLRFTTGAIAQAVGRRDVEVNLRTATVGIRGTDFWTMTDGEHDAACLFEGRIGLSTRDQGDLRLEQPTAFWARFFERPVQPVGSATPEQLATFLRSTQPRPGRGIAVSGGRWRVVAAAVQQPGQAAALARRLREAGYPARVRARAGLQEVRINALASRDDAAAVLEKIRAIEGVSGRVALAA